VIRKKTRRRRKEENVTYVENNNKIQLKETGYEAVISSQLDMDRFRREFKLNP
jgi:hypothetical protein